MLLTPAVTLGQPPGSGPQKASKASAKSALTSLLKWFGFGAPKTVLALRSDRGLDDANIWIMTLAEPKSAFALKIGRYRTPVFSSDASAIFALRADALARIPIGHPEQSVEIPVQVDPGEHAAAVVGASANAPEMVGLLTDRRRLIAVDAGSGTVESIEGGTQSEADLSALLMASRICADQFVFDGAQQTKTLSSTRTDIFIRPADKMVSRRVTAALTGSIHAQPSFSPDCTKVVFVSDER